MNRNTPRWFPGTEGTHFAGLPLQPQPLVMQVVWDVLEAAKDHDDPTVIAACRRLIVASRLGWRKYADPADVRLVLAFAA